MSDGLKLLAAAIAAGSSGTLTAVNRESLEGTELTAYDFIRRHYRQYRDLPSLATVQEETGVRLPAATEPLNFYIDQVEDRHEYNLIRERFAVFREGMQRADMGTVANEVSAMSRIFRRRRSDGVGQAVELSEGFRLVSDRLLEIRGTGGISGITTGWNEFDNITGGYQNSDLITWVGRMGLGKTYILLRQAMKAHEAGHNVLVVTTEMGIEQLARRCAALALGINPRLLKNGTISTYNRQRIRNLELNMIGSERFKIFSVGMNAKIDSIATLCYEYGPSIVFVDGVYLLRPTDMGRNTSRTDKVTAVYDELRGLNLDLSVPFVVTTQFNRQAGKGGKEGTLETIGYSDSVGTHSSHVVAMKPGPTDNPYASREFEFLKGREGETGSTVINFKFAPIDMEEMTREERIEEGDSEETVSWMGPQRRSDAA